MKICSGRFANLELGSIPEFNNLVHEIIVVHLKTEHSKTSFHGNDVFLTSSQ